MYLCLNESAKGECMLKCVRVFQCMCAYAYHLPRGDISRAPPMLPPLRARFGDVAVGTPSAELVTRSEGDDCAYMGEGGAKAGDCALGEAGANKRFSCSCSRCCLCSSSSRCVEFDRVCAAASNINIIFWYMRLYT